MLQREIKESSSACMMMVYADLDTPDLKLTLMSTHHIPRIFNNIDTILNVNNGTGEINTLG